MAGCAAFRAEVDGLKGRPAEEKIEDRCVVCLHDEEKDLLQRNVKQLWTNDDMGGVAPDAGADEVGIPWYSRDNGNLRC